MSIFAPGFAITSEERIYTKPPSLAGAADPRGVHLLSRYERRSYRSLQENLRLLNEMQTARRTQAKLLGVDFADPNGFGFANDKIAA
jgi:hypothetical protein